jgi:hypothetical protein
VRPPLPQARHPRRCHARSFEPAGRRSRSPTSELGEGSGNDVFKGGQAAWVKHGCIDCGQVIVVHEHSSYQEIKGCQQRELLERLHDFDRFREAAQQPKVGYLSPDPQATTLKDFEPTQIFRVLSGLLEESSGESDNRRALLRNRKLAELMTGRSRISQIDVASFRKVTGVRCVPATHKLKTDRAALRRSLQKNRKTKVICYSSGSDALNLA